MVLVRAVSERVVPAVSVIVSAWVDVLAALMAAISSATLAAIACEQPPVSGFESFHGCMCSPLLG